MADNWNDHALSFSPAESLHPNETSVRVLDEELDDEERLAKIKERADLLDGPSTLQQMAKRQELSSRVKSDPCYKFLMQVSAFSARRISKMTNPSGNGTVRASQPETFLAGGSLCSKETTAAAHDWLQIPAISGVLHLSADAYGHMKEAQMIANNFTKRTIELKDYVEKEQYQTLFARLVAIRMILSSTLAKSGHHKDRTHTRLHMEQRMVIAALHRVRRPRRNRWTEPM
jgi:hypothetical protein